MRVQNKDKNILDWVVSQMAWVAHVLDLPSDLLGSRSGELKTSIPCSTSAFLMACVLKYEAVPAPIDPMRPFNRRSLFPEADLTRLWVALLRARDTTRADPTAAK